MAHTVTGHCDACGHWVELVWSSAHRRWSCPYCDSTRVRVPPPGSPDARIAACECDPELNNDGRMQPEVGWYVFSGCPVHDPVWAEQEP